MSSKQTGGALMISLVLIFMMSLMGISSMRSATLDRRMSTNAVHKSRTLQAAESVTELALDSRPAIGQAMTSAFVDEDTQTTRKPVNVSVTLNDNTELATTATIQFTGMGLLDGWSTTFSGPQFQVTGNASLGNVNARSNVVQGAYVPAP